MRLARHTDVVGGLTLAAALATVAFLAGDGTSNLAGNTWVQVGSVACAGGVLIWWLLARVPGPRWGVPALAWFALLAVLTYASITWSVAPDTSWLEANRTLAYLGVFGAMAGAARMAPERWRAVVVAVALATGVVAGFALVVKVFPASLDAGDPLGRLNAPLGYWNGVGDIAALGIPAALWLGASPDSPRPLRIVSPPCLSALMAALLMSVSRGALVAAVIGVAAWFALVPFRLRAVAVMVLGVAGAAVLSAWALPNHGLSDDQVPERVRVVAGHHFGIVLLVTLGLCLTAAWGLVAALDHVSLRPLVRRRIGIGLVVLASLLPVGGVIALASSSRGLTGQISHLWSTLTNPGGGAGNQPSRLLTLSNSRTRYWDVGLTVGEHHVVAGAGAGGFAVAHRRYATVSYPIAHAHDYWIETFADLGLAGVLISLGLFGAWLLAARRTLGVTRLSGRRWGLHLAGPARSGEQAGLLTLAAVTLIFGLHSLVDWTWFIPGDAVPALACAGWLAGRGALAAPIGRADAPRGLTRSPGTAMACLVIVAALIACAWGVSAPWRAAAADAAAVADLGRGDTGAALSDARGAAAADPVALEPLYDLSAIYLDRGDARGARRELLDAVALQPQNPSPWQVLGSFDLARHDFRRALPEFDRALALDPHSVEIQALAAQARAG